MSRLRTDDTLERDTTSIFNFLRLIWSRQPTGWMFLAFRDGGGRWKELPINGNEVGDAEHLKSLIAKYAHRGDFYFCPSTFSAPIRKEEYALSTWWGHCDIDRGDLNEFPIKPSIAWETSPGRYQGLWLWNWPEPVEKAQAYNRTLAQYGDKGGWSITKYLRVPSTFNFKPEYHRPRVKLCHRDMTEIRERPKPSERWTQGTPVERDCEPSLALLKRLKRGSASKYLQPVVDGKRSDMICGLVCLLHKEGHSRDDMADALMLSPSFIAKRGKDRSKAYREIDNILRNAT